MTVTELQNAIRRSSNQDQDQLAAFLTLLRQQRDPDFMATLDRRINDQDSQHWVSLEVWIRLCREFRERERREILEQEPAQEVLALYREELKWMIRAARALLNVVSDPDFPQTEFVSEISGKLLQLESSWKSLNNPLTEAEADAFVQKHFADETPTGSAAAGRSAPDRDPTLAIGGDQRRPNHTSSHSATLRSARNGKSYL